MYVIGGKLYGLQAVRSQLRTVPLLHNFADFTFNFTTSKVLSLMMSPILCKSTAFYSKQQAMLKVWSCILL